MAPRAPRLESVRWKNASSNRAGTTPRVHRVMPLRMDIRFSSAAHESGASTMTRPSMAVADRPSCSHSRTSSASMAGSSGTALSWGTAPPSRSSTSPLKTRRP